MADIVQKVKYQVEVNTAELDQFKTAVDETNAAIGRMNTAFRSLATSIDQGMLKAFGTLNGRLSRFTTVATPAVEQLEKMVAPLGGLATSMTKAAEQFAAFTTSTNRALDDLRKFNAEIGRTKTESLSEAEVQSRTLNSKGLKWLKYYGIIRSGWETTKWVFNEIKEGAQNLDLERVLSQQITGFERQIARAQELTAGISSRASLVRSFALMSSFGLPMQQFAEQMELVQKMAIRTGQSADFLTESFARGISRLSPLILDNLGIQVSLTEANKAYANATGKVVTELTKEERIAAMTEEVLRKLEERTKGVSLTAGSAAAAVMRFETAIKDTWDTVKGAGGTAIEAVDEMFSSARATVSGYVEPHKALMDAFESQDKMIRLLGGPGGSVNDLIKQYKGLTEAFSFLSKDEGLADLFGNAGIFGTTVGQVNEVASTARQEFERYAAEVRSGISGINNLVRDREQVQIGGIFAIFGQNAGTLVSALEEVQTRFGGLLSTSDMLAFKSRMEAEARERSANAVRGAIAAQALGVPLVDALLKNLSALQDTQFKYYGHIVDSAKVMAFMAALNEGLLAGDKARLQETYLANDAAERMFNLKNGQLLTELNLSETAKERSDVLSKLADAEKRLLEDISDGEARLERDRLLARLTELNAIRDNKQAQLLADKEILASFQGMTKEKLKSIKDFYLASIKMLEVTLMAVPGSAQVKEQIQSFKNMIAELDKIINRGGRGGGSTREEYEPFKPIKNAKPTYYGWTIDDLLEVGGKLQEMREGFSIGGQVPGGFFGDSNFFGSVSADELKKAQDRLAEFDKARSAALGRFRSANMQERGLLGAFSDEASVEAFRVRLQQLADHFMILDQISTHLENTSIAMGTFRDGMDDLFGSDVVGMVTDFTSGMEGFTEALRANAGAYGLVNASMPMVRAFTQNIIKNRKAQAGIEALMQGAASWASYAEGNVAGGTMHAIAAGMYLAVAGGVLRLPKGKGKDTKPDDSAVKSQAVKGGDRHFHWHGQIATTEAERGAMIRDMIREAERAGM